VEIVGSAEEVVCSSCGSSFQLAQDASTVEQERLPRRMLERGWRWCRRNPVVACLTAAVAVALLVGTGVAWYFANRAITSEDKVVVQGKEVTELKTKTEIAGKETKEESQKRKDEEALRKKAEAARQIEELRAAKAAAAAKLATLQGDTATYANTLRQVQKALEQANVEQAWQLLRGCPGELRGWEHGYLLRRCEEQRGWEIPTDGAGVLSLAVSPDGKRLAGVRNDSTISIWNLENNTESQIREGRKAHLMMAQILFSPKGGHLATFSPAQDPKFLRPELRTISNEIQVVELASGKDRFLLKNPKGGFTHLAYNRQGTRLVTAAILHEPKDQVPDKARSVIQVWDALSGKEVASTSALERQIHGLSFSPDGKQFVTVEIDGEPGPPGQESAAKWAMRLWETGTCKYVRSFQQVPPLWGGIGFGPDGKEVLAWNAGTFQRWHMATGKPLPATPVAEAVGFTNQFTSDGRHCLTATVMLGGPGNQPWPRRIPGITGRAAGCGIS